MSENLTIGGEAIEVGTAEALAVGTLLTPHGVEVAIAVPQSLSGRRSNANGN